VLNSALLHTNLVTGLIHTNLSQSSLTNTAVGSDSWIAQSFVTGASSGGYILDSVQLLTAAASGAPGSSMVLQ
jgi:hypothetical protein